MRLEGKKVIALVSDDFEDLELWYPVYRLREEGAIEKKPAVHTKENTACPRQRITILRA